MNLSDQIREKILSLQTALTNQHPTMPTLLREIWKTLKENPDQVTLLEEDQIEVIVNGLKKQTNTEIVTAALKSKSGTKSLKSISLADL